MKRFNANLLWGVLLIAAGVLFLLQNMGYLKNFSASIWFVVFLAAGIGFLLVFTTNRAHWWALIPGGTMITLAVVTIADARAIESGGIFFLGLAVTFALIFLATRMRWP